MWGKRTKPYSLIGAHRLPCCRCHTPAEFQWQVCADGNNWRLLCGHCDIELNRMVLEFMGHPRAKELIIAYEQSHL